MTAYLYARVSRDDLTCSNQVHEVAGAGIHYDEVVCDVVSGAVAGADRDGLGALLGRLVRGDRVIVTKVDRLGRRASDVLALVADRTPPLHPPSTAPAAPEVVLRGLNQDADKYPHTPTNSQDGQDKPQ